jgi:uncharacterized RDD family membrane protein YckC
VGSISYCPPLVEAASIPPVTVRVIASFWRRLFAFVIDAVITGIPCYILGLVFYGWFSQFKAVAALTGYLLTLSYFVLLASDTGSGQTLGQRLLGIEVVKADGTHLSLAESLARYAILLVPLVGSGTATFLPDVLAEFLGYLYAFLTLAMAYLYIFNRRTRQTVHDLITGSYVVEDKGTGKVAPSKLWAGHVWVLVAIGVVTFGAMFPPVQRLLIAHGSFAELVTVRDAILNSGVAKSVTVNVMMNGIGQQRQTGLQIIVADPTSGTREKTAARIAKVIFQADPGADEKDFLTIVFNEGFSVGFAQYSKTYTVAHSIKEWQEIVAGETRN